MRGSVKKSALILGVLLLSIAAAGQVFPGRDSQADVPVVTERVLVPGGQSVGVRMDVRGVLVVGLEEIENETGEKINPGLVSGLQIGDTDLCPSMERRCRVQMRCRRWSMRYVIQ